MKFLLYFLIFPSVLSAQLSAVPEITPTKMISQVEADAESAARQRNWEKAAGLYRKLTESYPENADYHYKCGGSLAMAAQQTNKFRALGLVSDIRHYFQTAIKIDPAHIDARWGLIKLNLQLPRIFGGRESDAYRYAEQLLKISPVDGWLAKGHISESSGDYSSAEGYYKKAVRLGQSKTTYQKLADLYRKRFHNAKLANATMAAYHDKSKI